MKKHALNSSDLDLIKNYLTAGAAVGGGAALFTSLLNKINDIKEEDENPLEAHTLKLKIKKPEDKKPQIKMAADESSSLFRGPLALAGGAISTIGTYALVRHLYQKLKEKQLKNELEQAQDKYVTNLEHVDAANKQASGKAKPMGVLETLTSAPLAASLLLALGSGVVAHHTLNKTFPSIQRKSRQALGPKRVQVVYDRPGEENDEVIETIPVADLEKEASANAFLINTVVGFDTDSDVANLVKMAACGDTEYLSSVFAFANIDQLFEKSASYAQTAPEPHRLNMASNWCARHPGVAPSLSILAASEFADKAPLFFKAAGALPQAVKNALFDLVVNANAKVAAGVLEKIKEVQLPTETKVEAVEPKAPTLENAAESIDPQELLETLLAIKENKDLQTDQVADLQAESSEEAGQ